eukprot:10390958-Alexandrium_andersonii.AAC.1
MRNPAIRSSPYAGGNPQVLHNPSSADPALHGLARVAVWLDVILRAESPGGKDTGLHAPEARFGE